MTIIINHIRLHPSMASMATTAASERDSDILESFGFEFPGPRPIEETAVGGNTPRRHITTVPPTTGSTGSINDSYIKNPLPHFSESVKHFSRGKEFILTDFRSTAIGYETTAIHARDNRTDLTLNIKDSVYAKAIVYCQRLHPFQLKYNPRLKL